MSKEFTIKSHRTSYSVSFNQCGIKDLNNNPRDDAIYIIDKNISKIYKKHLQEIINIKKTLLIEATEKNKSINKINSYVESILSLGIKKNQPLIAIGGGIIQDITCFLSSILMRGLPWIFYPTTLLAQSDSCIGSKSSINSNEIKNIIGTFFPPINVIIDMEFISSLDEKDIFSGIGEMIKVHAISSPESFDRIAENYNKILIEKTIMEKFIYNSLMMKKKLIEIDEFDEGSRNVMNYGHSFGHAIESSTSFTIPHGIAITIGMDLANFVAYKLNISTLQHFKRMHLLLNKNCFSYRYQKIDMQIFMKSLYMDKKNTKNKLKLILPNREGKIFIGLYDKSSELWGAIDEYFLIYHK